MEDPLASLGSRDARERQFALDELGDALDQEPTSPELVRRALLAIQGVLAHETERPVLVSALRAAATAASRGLATLVSWDALAADLPRWENDSALLEFVLAILGASGERAHRPLVERFVGHSDPDVSRAARDAIAALDEIPRS